MADTPYTFRFQWQRTGSGSSPHDILVLPGEDIVSDDVSGITLALIDVPQGTMMLLGDYYCWSIILLNYFQE